VSIASATDLAHFRDVDARDVDDVEDLLVEHALEHDSPLLAWAARYER
jgi:hypothetical protein